APTPAPAALPPAPARRTRRGAAKPGRRARRPSRRGAWRPLFYGSSRKRCRGGARLRPGGGAGSSRACRASLSLMTSVPEEHRREAPQVLGFAVVTVSDTRTLEDDL